MKKNQDYFEILRTIQKKPATNQREMASILGFSLGKLNYCLQALQQKGLVKIRNFQTQPNKSTYIQYILTTRGIAERTKLTINFMKKKLREYDELKAEISNEDMSDFKNQSPKKIDHNLL